MTLKSSLDIQIRYSDVDLLGHVNNATFLTYYELGRIDFFRKFMNDLADARFVIAHIEVDFFSEVRLGDIPVCTTTVEKLGNTSVTFRSAISVRGEIASVCKAVLVYVDKENKPCSIPDNLRKHLAD